jgi:hemerythrin superfamily protein
MVSTPEKIASKAMGGMKAAKATIEGLSGVFRHLAQEHGEVTALLLRVKMSSDPKVRIELFPTIRKELLGHERCELDVVYPAMEPHAELQQMVAQHRQEAAELEKLLEQLVALDYRDEAWMTTFASMVDTIQRHTQEEENQIFPAAQRVLGDEESEALLPRFEAVKNAAPLH